MSSRGELIWELIGEAAGRLKIAGRCPAACCPADRASCTRAEGMGLRVCTCGSNDHDRRQHDHDRRPLARHDRHHRQAVTTGRTGHDHGKAARTLRRTHHNGPARLWPTDPCNPPDRHARRSPAATGTPCVPPCGPRRKRYCDPEGGVAPLPQGAAKKLRADCLGVCGGAWEVVRPRLGWRLRQGRRTINTRRQVWRFHLTT